MGPIASVEYRFAKNLRLGHSLSFSILSSGVSRALGSAAPMSGLLRGG